MTTRTVIAINATFALSALCACSGDEPGTTTTRGDPTVIDSGGTRTVINNGPRWKPDEEWTVLAQPELTLGMVDGPTEYLFDRVRGVTRLTDGTIVVLNSGDGQLRYYSQSGRHLRSVSRRGDGPGEIRDGRWLDRLAGDVVQVTHTNGRLRFGADGSLVADDRFNWGRVHEVGRAVGLRGSAGFLTESCGLPTPLFLSDSVLLCGSTYTDVRFIPGQAGRHESVSLVALADWSMERVDTVGIFGTRSIAVHIQAGHRVPVFMEPPYGTGGWMRVAGTPARFVFAPADSYRIEIHGLQPDSRPLIIKRLGGLRSPGEAELQRFDQAYTEAARFRRLTGGRGPDPSEFRAQFPPADSLSRVFGAPYIDVLGAVWAPLAVPYGAYDIFDPDGIYLGQVTMPARFRLHEIGANYILGVATDDLGVEYVVMYRLTRR